MKRIIISATLFFVAFAAAIADDKPITFEKIPQPAQNFVRTNYPNVDVAFTSMDNDIIYPEYKVVLVNGVAIEFQNDGRLECIKTRTGNIPEGIIPVQIIEEVKRLYHEPIVTEYEIERNGYEVKLSNGMELKFNGKFKLVEIDN